MRGTTSIIRDELKEPIKEMMKDYDKDQTKQTKIKEQTDIPNRTDHTHQKKIYSKLILISMYLIYYISVMFIGIAVSIGLNRYEYLSTTNIIYLSSYNIGVPLILISIMALSCLFGGIKIKSILKTEIIRIIYIIVLYGLLGLFKRDADILLILSSVYLITSIVLHFINKARKIAINSTGYKLSTIITSTVISGIALGTSSICMVILNEPIDTMTVMIGTIALLHIIGLTNLIQKRYKIRWLINEFIGCVIALSIFTVINYSLSNSVVLDDFYNKGYNTILELNNYKKSKGNLYTIKLATGSKDIKHIIDDNISLVTLQKTNDEYTNSLYKITNNNNNKYIVFNWDKREVISTKTEKEVMSKAENYLTEIPNMMIKNTEINNGTINITLQDNDLISLYIIPVEQGIALAITDKDKNKFKVPDELVQQIV